MSFDFSKLPVEMRTCEALRTELIRTHREFADKHGIEKEDLIKDNLRLKQSIEKRVCLIQIMFYVNHSPFSNVQDGSEHHAHQVTRSKLVKCNRELTRAKSMIDDLNKVIDSKDAQIKLFVQATVDVQKLESDLSAAQARIRDNDVRRPFDCLLLYD